MKNMLFPAIVSLLIGCASSHAEPPDQKPTPAASTNAQVTAVAPVAPPVDGLIIYGANHADTNWTRLTFMSTTNGQYMSVVEPRYDEYTATSTNSFTSKESDYAPKVEFPTNQIVLPVPTITVQSK